MVSSSPALSNPSSTKTFRVYELIFLSLTLALMSNFASAAQCELNIRNEWSTGYTLDVTINNDSDENITGWSIDMDFTDGSSINNIWNADLSGSTPQYVASNKSYNQTIQAQGSRNFGFNVNKANVGQAAILPTFGGICGSDNDNPNDPPDEQPPTQGTPVLQCEYSIVQEWGSGFTAAVKLTNNGDNDINSWGVGLLYPDQTNITGAWNSKFTQGNPNVFANANYNSLISVGNSVSFGFNANKAVSNTDASIPELSGMCGDTEVVNMPPVAVITSSVTETTTTATVVFDASQSSDPESDTLTYVWDFGDGTNSTEGEFTKHYDLPGEYTVSLVVNDGNLDSTPATFTISVIESNPPHTASAYTLDNTQSSIFFVSTKKSHVIETHEFTEFTGDISAQGHATLEIDLASIETGVEIRNERMKEHLFDTAQYPQANLSLAIDPDIYSDLNNGETKSVLITPILTIRSISVELSVEVLVTKLANDSLLVRNSSPIIIDALDFDLDGGIETLKNLANLSSIGYTVPSNFTFVFQVK